MDGKFLAQKAYFALIEETAEAQSKLLQAKQLTDMLGVRALPPLSIYRSSYDTLRSAPEKMARYVEHLNEQLARNYDLLQQMEAVFAEANEREMEAFAKEVGEMMRSFRKPGTKS